MTQEYPKGNVHLAWMHLIDKYAPNSVPSLLDLKKTIRKFKTCRNCDKYGHKAVHCPERKSEEKMSDTNSNTKYHFSGKCFYCSKVGHRINEHCTKKAAEVKAKVTMDEQKEQGNEKGELIFDLSSQTDLNHV